MINIQPILIKRQRPEANNIVVTLINDNLINSATFQVIYYSNEEYIDIDSVGCDGNDYENWDNSNEAAIQFVVNKLNLNLV